MIELEKDRIFEPEVFRLNSASDAQKLQALQESNQVLFIHDDIYTQLKELIKCHHPSRRLKIEEYDDLINAHLKGQALNEYGIWVYYPWSKRLVHLLDEEEFVTVRTNRNQFKITKEEQRLLNQKAIGIVGLSVGQSIAITIAMERICGELRLADFDTAELSNLNRLRTGVHNLGILKTIIAAREIMEIDPFLKVKLFHDGITKGNMDEFFTGGKKLDILVEVCDGLDIKIESRYKARELGIPVVMDTNDRGMLDVERFDLEPGRPVLHGLAEGLDPVSIKNLSNEDKIPFILKIVGAETISTRLKTSMMEVEQSINTWPQLASSVVLGGALTTDVCRRILLDQYHESGRYYVDLDDLVKDEKTSSEHNIPSHYLPPDELTREYLVKTINNFDAEEYGVTLSQEEIQQIVKAGIIAPSGGNAQPWKFVYSSKGLFIFHDAHFSHSLLDYNHLGSYIAIGAVMENITVKAASMQLKPLVSLFPASGNPELAAHISFIKSNENAHLTYLEPAIPLRVTNRELSKREALSPEFYNNLHQAISGNSGAKLIVVDNEVLMEKLGSILATAEMLRIMHPRGHYDTFTNELRWTEKEIHEKMDGLDVNTLGASKPEVAALKIAEDPKAIAFLRELKGGTAFTKMVKKAVGAASAIGIITMPGFSEENFILGGMAMERLWLEANLASISFQPVTQLVFLTARYTHGGADETDPDFNEALKTLNEEFLSLVPEIEGSEPVFIFRFSKAGAPSLRSLRRPLESTFFTLED